MNRMDGVIFDFDGVIADTRRDVWASVEYAAAGVSGVMEQGFMEKPSHVALPEAVLFRHIEPLPGADMFEKFCSCIRIHYRTINPFRESRLYPGIPEIFAYLKKQGILWVVVSSKPEPALKRLIELKEWENYVPVHYSLDSIHGAGTKEAVYEYLMNHELEGRQPVCIGDTWSDVSAAKACGFPCIGALFGDGDREALLAQRPEYLASTGWELFDILKGMIKEEF